MSAFFQPRTLIGDNGTQQHGLLLSQRALGSCRIRFDWLVMSLQTQLGTPSSEINLDLTLGTRGALVDFRESFRDSTSFRSTFLKIAEVYMRAGARNVRLQLSDTQPYTKPFPVNYSPESRKDSHTRSFDRTCTFQDQI